MMSTNNITPIILCGGAGRRLWPLSTSKRPKPFLKLFGDHTLLDLTVQRIAKLNTPLIACAAQHAKFIPSNMGTIVTEPKARNTAPALLNALRHIKGDPIILVLPADHLIPDTQHFLQIIEKMAKTLNNTIATIGIKPRTPSQHFGYIQKGQRILCADPIYKVQSFTEKPNATTARQYIKSDRYLWNAGIFMARRSTFIEAFQAHAPEIYTAKTFAQSPTISIDHAIMERANNVITIEANLEWADLGSWKSLLNALIKQLWHKKQHS